MHGGKSTGPRTAEGKEPCRQAKLKHGGYTRKAVLERRNACAARRSAAQLLKHAQVALKAGFDADDWQVLLEREGLLDLATEAADRLSP
jgi:hypothetical protein